jgi:hypothetical protein
MIKISTIFSVFLLLGAFAVHADDSASGSSANTEGSPQCHYHHHLKMTAAQKACFTANGLTAPGEGPRPTERPSQDVMEKVHACLEENGMKPHPHGPGDQDGSAD